MQNSKIKAACTSLKSWKSHSTVRK